MIIIRLAKQNVETHPQPSGRCPRCGCQGWHKWGSPKLRSVVDLRVGKVATQRYRCKNCTKTVTVKPKGVSKARRSQPLMALVGVLYSLGLSHRGIELVLGLFEHSVDHVSSWRDMQKLGKAVRNRLPKGRARVVGVDETWLKVKGKTRPVGVVVDVGVRTLGIELSGAGFDYRAWFQGMSDELGVEVVVTDDSTDYSLGIDEAGLSRQQCLVHMKRTLGRAKGRLGKTMGTRYGGLLEQITEMVRELAADGAERLLKRSVNRELPQKLRRLVVHLLERWRQMTVHQRLPEVPVPTGWREGSDG